MRKSIAFWFIFCAYLMMAQDGFVFSGKKSKITIPIEFVNNLIIVPLELNGYKMNFLLDTGVEESILFSIEQYESVLFDDLKPIKLKGLGGGEPVDAFKSNGNKLKITNHFLDNNHTVYVILNQEINISPRVGVPVNGIIGYHFFKNYLVEIDYIQKRIIVWRDNKVSKNKLKNYQVLNLEMVKNKPFLQSKVWIEKDTISGRLLLDTGNSDAFWLFESQFKMDVSKPHLVDFLGKGFNGDVFGKRTRLDHLKIGDIMIPKPIVSFPDSLSIKNVWSDNKRIGSIGSEFLKRNHCIWDYSKKKLYLKPNKWIQENYEHNLSGIEVSHSGMQWKSEAITMYQKNTNSSVVSALPSVFYKVVLKPVYNITQVIPTSEAYQKGLRSGDILISIQNKNVSEMKLGEIVEILKSGTNKKIKIEYERNGIIKTLDVTLKRQL